MKIIEMEREDLLRERKRIEARVTRNLLRTNATIFTLPKTNYGMILSFSPFNINSCTNSFVKSESRWKYSHISNRLHTYEDERNILEKEMRMFINFKEKDYLHTILSKFIYYDFSVRYCIKNKLPIISKQNHNKLKKLINKWKEVSKDMHYKPTKQEKRKLKKLASADRTDVVNRLKTY
jgi:hypothetical protein